MTCKDCLHYNACLQHHSPSVGWSENDGQWCKCFTDKSEWVHLPCKKGDVLIRNGIRCKVDHWNVIATAFTEDEKCRLFGIEEAEKALEESSKNNEQRETD